MKRVGARGYGVDLRERIVLAVREGKTVEEAAQQYRVHLQTVQRYLDLDDQGMLDVYVKPSGRPFTLQAEHEQQLLRQLDEHADATLVEHACMLETATGLNVSFKTVDRAFTRMNITHKKNAGRQRAQ
jgi:transposase